MINEKWKTNEVHATTVPASCWGEMEDINIDKKEFLKMRNMITDINIF